MNGYVSAQCLDGVTEIERTISTPKDDVAFIALYRNSFGSLLPFTLADVDLNGKLDLNDVLAFAAGWGLDGPTLNPEQRVRQGDLNFDGVTDLADWQIFHHRWLQENNAPLSLDAVLNPIPGDYNFNGVVTQADLEVWQAGFGTNHDGHDFLVWQRSLGNSNDQPPMLDTLALFIDPNTGTAQLKNDTGSTMNLVGYSVISANDSLLPGDDDWNSLQDQALSGWEEAAPTISALSELNAFGSLALAAGDWISLGNLVDLSAPHMGFSLEFALDTVSQFQEGYVVFAEFIETPGSPTAPMVATQLASNEQAATVPKTQPAPLEALRMPPLLQTTVDHNQGEVLSKAERVVAEDERYDFLSPHIGWLALRPNSISSGPKFNEAVVDETFQSREREDRGFSLHFNLTLVSTLAAFEETEIDEQWDDLRPLSEETYHLDAAFENIGSTSDRWQ